MGRKLIVSIPTFSMLCRDRTDVYRLFEEREMLFIIHNVRKIIIYKICAKLSLSFDTKTPPDCFKPTGSALLYQEVFLCTMLKLFFSSKRIACVLSFRKSSSYWFNRVSIWDKISLVWFCTAMLSSLSKSSRKT